MKRFLLKFLSLVLLLATLFPLAVACKKDPPPNKDDDDDDDDNGGQEETTGDYYFKLLTTAKTDSTLINFDDPEFVNLTNRVKNNITEKDGKTVLKWVASSQLDAPLPVYGSLEYVTSIRFSVYSEKATGTVVEVGFVNPVKPGGTWSAVARIEINFTGWKNFDYPANQISGYGARDNTVAAFRLKANKNADNSQPSDTLYFTSIEITTESYGVQTPEGVDINDPAIYSKITSNARELFVGNDASAQTNEHKAKLADVNSECKIALDKYKAYKAAYPDSDVEHKLFDIEVIKEYWAGERATQSYYEYVYDLAIGYGMKGSAYYQSEEVLNAIIHCLEYGYNFYYGPSLIEYGLYGNWWQWEIGIPMNMIPALIIIEDKLTVEQLTKYLTVFDRYVPYPSAKGGNKIWLSRLSILSAALRHDALDLCVNVHYMNDLFDYIDDYIEDEGGFFNDGSFIQHSYYAYTSGYGGNYMGDLPQMMYYLSGSRFFPQQENIQNHYDWVFDAFRPIIYDKCVMAAMAGRNVARHQGEGSSGYAANMILIHYYAPDSVKAELEPIIAYFMKLYNTDFSGNVALPLISYAKELGARLSAAEVKPYEITKVFGMMARVVHHGPEYGVCLSMSNLEVGKYESINNENRTGWYHGDGMIQIYTDGYSFNGNFYSFANPYLMPGTTVNSAERNKALIGGLFNASPYAGGVSQGKYGSVGFILDYDCINTSFKNSETDSTIYAKKSYFFFDNEIVCVGSDIQDMSGTDVKTVLENRYWRPSGDTVSIGETVGGETVMQAISSPATVQTEISSRVVHFSNMGGYVILRDDGTTLYYKKASNSYNGTITYDASNPMPDTLKTKRDFFELYMSHGVGNTTTGELTNNDYFYAYLPEASAEETAEYYDNPDVALIYRNEYAHAVIETTLGTVAANFFIEDGEETTVEVNGFDCTAVKNVTATTPCCIMLSKGENGEYLISVSDPTNTYSNIPLTIEIEGVSTVVSADTGVNASVANGIVTLNINASGSLRQTFNLTVK